MAKKGTGTSGSGDRTNLYFAAPWLSLDNRKALGLTVPACIYVQDPLVARRNRRLGLEEIHQAPAQPQAGDLNYPAGQPFSIELTFDPAPEWTA